jgi:hypothetical protein
MAIAGAMITATFYDLCAAIKAPKCMVALNVVKKSTSGILAAFPSSNESRPLVHIRIPCFPSTAHRCFLLELSEPDLGQKK